ncbi:MAG: hypothetical protein WCT85_00535 [Parachlamydiales bacterium]|jgi:hypothetical protein
MELFGYILGYILGIVFFLGLILLFMLLQTWIFLIFAGFFPKRLRKIYKLMQSADQIEDK